jgi:DNA-binding phage protein
MYPTTQHPDLTSKHMPVVRDEILEDLVGLIRRSSLSAKQIAADAGVSRSTIGKWLDNSTTHPRLHTMSAVAEVLGYKFVLMPQQKN